MQINIKDIVKDNTARFSYWRSNVMYYTLPYDGKPYKFPIYLDPEDIGTASLLSEYKAITLMRYIREAIEEGTFVPA